jgi:hypothetical protein
VSGGLLVMNQHRTWSRVEQAPETGMETQVGLPGRAQSRRGCTGWAPAQSSQDPRAAPQSKWLSQNHWRPAERGRALENQHRAAPPRILHPEETGRKEVDQI